MSQPSQCIVIEDDVIVMVSGYYLPSGGDTTIVLPNNGGFYHFEAGLTAGQPQWAFHDEKHGRLRHGQHGLLDAIPR